MANKWITHIKKTMKQMKKKGTYKKGLGLKQVIMEAKKHWHKGGAESGTEPEAKSGTEPDSDEETAPTVPPAEGGRKRRRSKKTHRRRH